jgi:phosphate/sulfate permease
VAQHSDRAARSRSQGCERSFEVHGARHFSVSSWVKLSCGLAIALGTYIGGWRIINTMGNRLTEIESSQGFAAESAGASVILASSYFGIRCRPPMSSPAR